MLLVSQAGARASRDGTLPNIFGRINKKGIPAAGIVCTSVFMTVLMVSIMLFSKAANTQEIFGHIANIAVILTLPPYLYSAFNLIRIHGFRDRKAFVSLAVSLVASVFCFIALAGESRAYLAAAMIIMLGVFIFYVGKKPQASQG